MALRSPSVGQWFWEGWLPDRLDILKQNVRNGSAVQQVVQTYS